MYINGLEFKTETNYKIKTELGLEWFQTSDGNFYSTDWSSKGDIYRADISTFGREDYVNSVITQFESIKNNGNLLLMSGFYEDEKIFGEDIDYTLVSGVIVNMDVREAVSWKMYTVSLEVQAIKPSFGTFPAFTWTNLNVGHQHKSGRNYKPVLVSSYSSNMNVYDHKNEDGITEFELNLTNQELASLRQFQRTTRGNSFTLPANSIVEYPFGPVSGNGPHTVKLIGIKEDRRISPFRWSVKVTLSEFV